MLQPLSRVFITFTPQVRLPSTGSILDMKREAVHSKAQKRQVTASAQQRQDDWCSITARSSEMDETR